MNHHTRPPDQAWRQVLVHFDDYTAAEHIGIDHLGPEMTAAESTGQITSWFFIRKNPCWRLRFLPTNEDTGQDAATAIYQRLDALQEAAHIANWVETIYEPETHAFGGAEAMTVSHDLFHADSKHTLVHLADSLAAWPENRRDQRRELSILLCRNLMHGASQDWYEQGDVWARVAETRPAPPETADNRLNSLEIQLRQLMTVDVNHTGPLLGPQGALAHISDWAADFVTCGRELGKLAHAGLLCRGTRAILAHQVIFHWNRLGLSRTAQGLLAHTAKAVVFGHDEVGR